MMVVLIVALVVVAGVVVAVVVGKVGSDSMAEPNRTSSFELPPGRLGSDGVESLRFEQSLRGYNMAQVDAVLDKLHDELRALERQVGVEELHPVSAHDDAVTEQEHPGDIVPFRTRRQENHADDR